MSNQNHFQRILRILERIEKKLDQVLKNTSMDFSKEDKLVKQMTKKVEEAIKRVPHAEKKTKGK